MMDRVTVELDEPLVAVLELLEQPIDRSVRELTVLDLYRRARRQQDQVADMLIG